MNANMTAVRSFPSVLSAAVFYNSFKSNLPCNNKFPLNNTLRYKNIPWCNNI